LKRKAADYLFKYMPYHYYETCQWLESYLREVADILNKNLPQDFIVRIIGKIDIMKLKTKEII